MTESLSDLTLLRERIKCRKDSQYDNQFIELLDILIRQHTAAPDVVERVAKALIPFVKVIQPQGIVGDGEEGILTRANARALSIAAIAAMGTCPKSTSDNADSPKQNVNGIIQGEISAIEHYLHTEGDDKTGKYHLGLVDAFNASRPYLRTTELPKLCPYIVSSDEGTSYCSLAEAPKPVSVSLEKCGDALAKAWNLKYPRHSLNQGAKAVLEAAGVKYVD